MLRISLGLLEYESEKNKLPDSTALFERGGGGDYLSKRVLGVGTYSRVEGFNRSFNVLHSSDIKQTIKSPTCVYDVESYQ